MEQLGQAYTHPGGGGVNSGASAFPLGAVKSGGVGNGRSLDGDEDTAGDLLDGSSYRFSLSVKRLQFSQERGRKGGRGRVLLQIVSLQQGRTAQPLDTDQVAGRANGWGEFSFLSSPF